MTYSRILLLLLGLMLAASARAELPASLAQAAAQLATAPDQRQSMVADLADALKSGVTEQDLQSVMRLAVTNKYSAANAAAFIRQLATMRKDDLPVALVRDKILEGMAKKVPSANILAVASEWQAALRDARSSVQAMEERGLKYKKDGERDTLINLGAGLRQHYGAKEALPRLAESASAGGRMAPSAGNLIAAGNLAELFLLHNATLAQALELPSASLRAGYTPGQIQTLQRDAFDQFRQGVAPEDIVAGMRRQFGPAWGTPPTRQPFNTPVQPLNTPGGSWPGSGPGNRPGGMPGGSYPH